jgi:hypothetical protein
MIKYSEVIDEITGSISIRAEFGDGIELSIPTDLANSDYQAYLNRDKPKAALSTPIVSSNE